MTTFQLARLKLTVWYLLIIMFVSVLFSIAIYTNTSRQIKGLIRMQNERVRNFRPQLYSQDQTFFKEAPPMISTVELENELKEFALNLLIINLVIFVVSGGAGYFLAGRTLQPIKLMIDEQNQFISDASHELRTPIATLRAEMESQLMEKKIVDKQARELISSNLEDLSALQNMVNRMLKITKIHSISSDRDKQPVSLAEVINSARERIITLANKKRISIALDMSEAIIKGDKTDLIELFVVLFDNAIKYSPEGSKIRVTSKKADRTAVRVSVKDQGQGIGKEDLPHIFERFYRADKSRSRDGYGLGLSIAKKIIDSHKGSISVVSKLNKGSIFTVELPIIRV